MVGYGAPEGGRHMNIAILDDYQDTIRTLNAFKKMAGVPPSAWRGGGGREESRATVRAARSPSAHAGSSKPQH